MANNPISKLLNRKLSRRYNEVCGFNFQAASRLKVSTCKLPIEHPSIADQGKSPLRAIDGQRLAHEI